MKHMGGTSTIRTDDRRLRGLEGLLDQLRIHLEEMRGELVEDRADGALAWDAEYQMHRSLDHTLLQTGVLIKGEDVAEFASALQGGAGDIAAVRLELSALRDARRREKLHRALQRGGAS